MGIEQRFLTVKTWPSFEPWRILKRKSCWRRLSAITTLLTRNALSPKAPRDFGSSCSTQVRQLKTRGSQHGLNMHLWPVELRFFYYSLGAPELKRVIRYQATPYSIDWRGATKAWRRLSSAMYTQLVQYWPDQPLNQVVCYGDFPRGQAKHC